jgi:phosphomannomutase
MAPENPRIIALFDVDGTLTIPRGEITSDMLEFVKTLSKKITVGIVGGSDLPKQEEQLGEGIVHVFPYNFSQNGLVAYKDGVLQEVQTISKFLGEDNVKRIVNWTMRYLADIDIPVKVCLLHAIYYLFILPFLESNVFSSRLSPISFSFTRGEHSSNSAAA